MNSKIRGTICGILAAICYGTNPLGALGLQEASITTGSILFYRFGIALLLLGGLLMIRKESLAVTLKEFSIVVILGTLFGVSSLGLFLSFNYMEAGIASTILFVYPVIVAVLMSIFFKEKATLTTIVSILLSLGGIALLYQGDGGENLSLIGIMFVLLSSTTYAVYIIITNKMPLALSPMKITFYSLIFATLTVVAYSLTAPERHIQWLTSSAEWGYAVFLAIVPTVISLILITIAAKEVGSTPTAIMGALEPLTAVLIGVLLFGERFTLKLAIGIVLIMGAVLLIIIGNVRTSRKKKYPVEVK